MRRFAGKVLGLLLCCAAMPALAAPSSDLWERWLAHDPASTASVDHSAWQTILDSVLILGADKIRRVQYRKLVGGTLARLRDYVDRLQTVPVSTLNRDEQFAYWVNLYNALTLRVVAEHYPVASIRDIDISPGLFADGPWGADLAIVEGEPISLDDIEHRILRPIWQDPRIHYAVNCASVGCPDLAPDAYAARELDRQLNAAAFRFINHPRGVAVIEDKLVVSSIYHWFAEDFGNSESGVLAHLRDYAAGPLEQKLKNIDDIYTHDYDWTLNDQALDSSGTVVSRIRRRLGS